MLDRTSVWLDSYPGAAALVGAVVLFLVAVLSHMITRRYLLRILEKIILNTKFQWDDVLLQHRVLRRAALLAPVFVLYFGVQLVPHVPEEVEQSAMRLILALLAITIILLISSILTTINAIYAQYPISQNRPIKGYLQIVKIFIFILGGVLAIALILDRSPFFFLTGIGAMTAVILLIFRDTILSFVASLQIASNDMVRIGDWIEMPKYGADGDVIDLALHTVKIQNFDKTITTIPTYKLIEDSFKNWRGMKESGGRRIKRAINVDMTTVRFLDDEDIAHFEKFVLLRDYIQSKKAELDEYNARATAGTDMIANARRLTNLGTFRAYLVNYLRQHPAIHSERMTFLIRQLESGPEGIPLELYVFSTTTAWAEYEGVQADIFDHILAIIPEFGLRVFQKPSGHDLVAFSPVQE
ncbi:MAG: mechanosensitive ion channel family protein [Acidobacteria bacterium]|nr:mechanosensitive ion channel family protein [Acidobacteriota bacterium]